MEGPEEHGIEGREGRLGEMGKKRKREDEVPGIAYPKSLTEDNNHDVTNDDFEGFDNEDDNGEISILSDEDDSDSIASSRSTSEESNAVVQEEQASTEVEKG